jgi:hypothetical protein
MSITATVVVNEYDFLDKLGKAHFHVTDADANACDGAAHNLGLALQHVTQGDVTSASMTHTNKVTGTTAINTGRFWESVFRMEVEIPTDMPGVFAKIGIPAPTDALLNNGSENTTLNIAATGPGSFQEFYGNMVANKVSTNQGTLITAGNMLLCTGNVKKNNRKGGN